MGNQAEAAKEILLYLRRKTRSLCWKHLCLFDLPIAELCAGINEVEKNILKMHSLYHFAATTMAPMFEVYEVYNDNDHPAHESLWKDLENISEEMVEWYQKESGIKHLFESKELLIDKKLLAFVDIISKEIDKLRINCLLTQNEQIPLPYNHSSLENIKLDNNFLSRSSEFEIIRGGICRNNEAFTLLPGTNATNSCYWLFDVLFGIGRDDLIKVRLDPLIHEPLETFNPMMFKMQVYGTSFNWERIKVLKGAEHTQFLPDFPSAKDIFRPDVVWKPIGKEIHFTCEEMPKADKIQLRGSRYFHAIFERQTGIIKHCDAAIRYYDDDEYEKRIPKHIKSNEVTRIGKRIKIFQIDVPKEELSAEPITAKFLKKPDL